MKNYNFISTQHVTRVHDSTSKKLSFPLIHPVVYENKIVYDYFRFSEVN